MQLTLHSDYSLRVLLYLSQMPKEATTIKEISEFYKISGNHLVKVVRNLVQLGFILSLRGKGGGIKLARSPAEISIGEVLRKTESNYCLAECFNKMTNCCVITNVCHLKGVLNQALEAFFNVLDKSMLIDGSKNNFVNQIINHLNI